MKYRDANDIVHSTEKPILDIPRTENRINSYANQIIFGLHTKTRVIINLTENYLQEILQFNQNFVDSKKPYYLNAKESILDLFPVRSTRFERPF